MQVQQLQDQVILLGGQLNRVGPVEASVDIILEQQGGGAAHIKEQLGGGATPSKGGRKKRLGSGNKSNRSNKTVTSATTNGQTSDVAMEISTLLNENEMLKKKLTSLEAHLSSNNNKDNMKKHSPVLRQPSVMFALSSVRNMENGTPEDRSVSMPVSHHWEQLNILGCTKPLTIQLIHALPLIHPNNCTCQLVYGTKFWRG